MKKKKILCFFIGYISDDVKYNETVLVNMAEIFSNKYDVFVFGNNISNFVTNNVSYLNSSNFIDFQKNNKIDIIILYKYIYHFLEFEIKARKIFIWCQSKFILPYYESLNIKNNAKGLLTNIIDNIDGIITLTNYHKKDFQNFYNIDENKIFVIDNIIKPDIFKVNFKKQKNKFIWISYDDEALRRAIDYFHEIVTIIKDAEFYIYRTDLPDDIFYEIGKYDYFYYYNNLLEEEIFEEFYTSDIWFYPTNLDKIYYPESIIAQMSKCVCVTTKMPALVESIGDRGVLINENICDEKFREKFITEIIKILNNDKIKYAYQESAYNWSKEQKLENKIKKWYELFK